MSDFNLDNPSESAGKIIVFGSRQIRRQWVKDAWFFSVVDIIEALTDSPNPRNYWNMMKARESKEAGIQLSTLCVQLKLTSSDGKTYKTDCVNTEAAFRIIQSIPSPKAEPQTFRWAHQRPPLKPTSPDNTKLCIAQRQRANVSIH